MPKTFLEGAENDLVHVKQDTVTTYQEFLQEAEEQIKVYEKHITGLKVKIAKKKEKKRTMKRKTMNLKLK
jgi:hypothetical protein